MRRRAWLCAAPLLVAGCIADDGASDLDAPLRGVEVRPDTPGNSLQFNFDAGDVVETFDSTGGRFRVHFARAGNHAVSDTDDDRSGVPDFVEQVGSVYEEVLTFYEDELGFRAPLDDGAIRDNGGSDRFDVYLVNFAGVGDGNFQVDSCQSDNPEVCAGYMIQENDYAGYGYPSTLVANRILGSHEFFHAVQAGYDREQGSVLAEGTAVWATEQFDPSLDDFEYFIDGYLQNPDRPIDEPLPGPVDPFSYGSAIVFQFLEERYGPGIIRALWEACENGANGVADPAWIEVLDPTLQANAGVSFGDALAEMVRWNLYTADFANPTESYDGGAAYPRVRIDAATAPFMDDELRMYHASAQYFGLAPAGRATMTAALVATEAEPEATADLALLLATETGTTIATVPLADVAAGTQTIDTSGAARLIVAVINRATGGSSKKPGVCIGTVEEVAACKQSLGAITSGAGGAAATPVVDDGQCGCTLPGKGGGQGAAPWLIAALALLRRRNSARLAAWGTILRRSPSSTSTLPTCKSWGSTKRA